MFEIQRHRDSVAGTLGDQEYDERAVAPDPGFPV
jgi:hypothetical protein